MYIDKIAKEKQIAYTVKTTVGVGSSIALEWSKSQV